VDHAAPFSGCDLEGVEGSGGHVGGPGLTAGVSSLGEKRLVCAVCSDQGRGHLSRLRPNICVVTLEEQTVSSISDIACSMCTCADERWTIRSWLHYLRAESTVQQAVDR
jgi:hypothetical protein